MHACLAFKSRKQEMKMERYSTTILSNVLESCRSGFLFEKEIKLKEKNSLQQRWAVRHGIQSKCLVHTQSSLPGCCARPHFGRGRRKRAPACCLCSRAGPVPCVVREYLAQLHVRERDASPVSDDVVSILHAPP